MVVANTSANGIAAIAGLVLTHVQSELRSGVVYSSKSGAKGVKLISRGSSYLSVGLSLATLVTTPKINPSDFARFIGSLAIAGTNVIPYGGPFISFGLGIADAAGKFDSYYASFDEGVPNVNFNKSNMFNESFNVNDR